MTRNMKVLGLALFGALAMYAVAAQAAFAVDHQFKVGAAGAEITAEADPTSGGIQKFTPVGAGISLECKVVHLTGKQAVAEQDTLTLTPQYSECTAGGTFPVTVTNVGNTGAGETKGACSFVFDSDTSANGSTSGKEDAPVDIECETGKSIEIHIYANASDHANNIPICTINVGAAKNQGLNGIKFTNRATTGKKEEVTAEATVHKVHYSSTGPLCALAEVAETGTAVYEGNATVRAIGTDATLTT